MRNLRRLILTEDFIATHHLSTEPPPPDSLFWTMWNTWLSVAKEALATGFVQSIKNGTLDPTVYGSFNVSDAYYCFNGAKDYHTAAHYAKDPVLKAFLLEKFASYEKYNVAFPRTWHVRDGSSIVPMAVTKEYSDFEREIAKDTCPIYTLVCMIPCEIPVGMAGRRTRSTDPRQFICIMDYRQRRPERSLRNG